MFREEVFTKNMVMNLFRYQECVVAFVSGLPDDTYSKFSEGEKIHLQKVDVYSDHHFILGENSRFNVRLAKAVIDTRIANNLKGEVNIYVRIENSPDADLLCEWLDSVTKNMENVFVHVIRETELLSEKYIEEYPFVGGAYPLIDSDFETGLARPMPGSNGVKILMIGFGNRGQALMNAMIQNGNFIGHDGETPVPFSADLIAKDEECFRTYKDRSGETWDAYNLDAPYGSLDVNSVEFDEKVLSDIERLKSYGRVVVCTGEDALNVSVADRICKWMKLNGIPVKKGWLFVQVKSEEFYNRLVYGEDAARKKLSLFGNVEFFGMWNEIFTYENIVEKEKYNRTARWLNWYYWYQNFYETEKMKLDNNWNSPRDAIGAKTDSGERVLSDTELWRTTDWFGRLSTASSCVGQRNLLALIGYKSVDEKEYGIDAEDVFGLNRCVNGTNPLIILMAKNEHLRWMAFVRTHGVLSWDLKSPSVEHVKELSGAKKVKANQIKVIGRHAAIAPFESLAAVDKILAEASGTSSAEGIECFAGRGAGFGFENNLQWNDIKFVRWIPELMYLCGRKIVKMGE